jgi:membrane protein YqaA with SNARE-associated domain
MEFLAEFGYIGLFASSFLAATILPLSSEIVLSVLLLNGLNPISLVAVATIGNVLGSVVNYGLGLLAVSYSSENFPQHQKRRSMPHWPDLKNMAPFRCSLRGCRS